MKIEFESPDFRLTLQTKSALSHSMLSEGEKDREEIQQILVQLLRKLDLGTEEHRKRKQY